MQEEAPSAKACFGITILCGGLLRITLSYLFCHLMSFGYLQVSSSTAGMDTSANGFCHCPASPGSVPLTGRLTGAITIVPCSDPATSHGQRRSHCVVTTLPAFRSASATAWLEAAQVEPISVTSHTPWSTGFPMSRGAAQSLCGVTRRVRVVVLTERRSRPGRTVALSIYVFSHGIPLVYACLCRTHIRFSSVFCSCLPHSSGPQHPNWRCSFRASREPLGCGL